MIKDTLIADLQNYMYHYQVLPGNNSSLIKKVIQKTRGNYWKEITLEMEKSLSLIEVF